MLDCARRRNLGRWRRHARSEGLACVGPAIRRVATEMGRFGNSNRPVSFWGRRVSCAIPRLRYTSLIVGGSTIAAKTTVAGFDSLKRRTRTPAQCRPCVCLCAPISYGWAVAGRLSGLPVWFYAGLSTLSCARPPVSWAGRRRRQEHGPHITQASHSSRTVAAGGGNSAVTLARTPRGLAERLWEPRSRRGADAYRLFVLLGGRRREREA